MESNKFFGVTLALLPPIGIYSIVSGITLAVVLIFISVFIYIIDNKNKISLSNPEWRFYVIITILGLISWLTNSSTGWYSSSLFVNNYLNLSINFIAIILLSYKCNVKYFIWTVIIIAIAASLICIYQWAMVVLNGTFVTNIYLPWFEINRNIESISITRPCAFFTEPAHVCMYIAPVLYTSFLMKKYLISFILICGMLFSTSTTGLLLVVIIPCIYFYKKKYLFRYIILMFSILGIGYAFISFFLPDLFDFATAKIGNTDISENQRLLGPLRYLKYFGVIDCLFGIGLNQLENFVINARGGLLMEGSGNYANSILYMYISYGIIGLMTLVLYLYHNFKKSKNCIGYWIIFLAVLASDQILFAYFFVYLVTFIILASKIKENRMNFSNDNFNV